MFDQMNGSDSAGRAERFPVSVEPYLSPQPGDQLATRVRAANYFALVEFYKKPKRAEEAWFAAAGAGVVDKPFEPGISGALQRLDADEAGLLEAHKRVAEGIEGLNPSDLVLERGRAGYPVHLARLTGAPLFLFVRQDENVLERPSISVVGTRDASDAGRSRARRLAYLLVRRGIAVCSGLARGIDHAAHLGALESGGTTIAVLGTPITRTYPKEHKALQERIGFVGALVSQFHPASKTLPLCFPLRNATMSGLSIGTVVVEASETSGALIQAKKALEQGRKVFIPRTAIDDPRLRWPKQLAQRGAEVFGNIEDLVAVLEREQLVPSRETPAPSAARVAGHAS